MRTFIRMHTDWLLTGVGLLIAGLVCWFLVWGVTLLADNIGDSLATPSGVGGGERFNIEEAAKLDFRGLN